MILENKRKTKNGWVADVKDKPLFVKHFTNKIEFANELKNYEDNKLFLDLVLIEKIDINNKIIFLKKIENIKNKTLHSYLLTDKQINIKDIIRSVANLGTIKVCDEKITSNYDLFIKRTSLIKEYILDASLKTDTIIVNGVECKNDFIEICQKLNEVISREKYLLACVSQGDPTDINILLNNKVIDFETVGFNSIISLLAVFASNLYLGSYYFSIKYAASSYLPYKKDLQKFEQNVKIDLLDSELVSIIYSIKIPNCYKKLLLDLFLFIKRKSSQKLITELNKYFKYYFIFRFLTPKDIRKFDKKDKFLMIALVIYFYHNLNDIDDMINLINDN